MNMHESQTGLTNINFKYSGPGPNRNSIHSPGHCLQMGNGRIKIQKLNEVARLNLMYTGQDRMC